MQFVGSNYRCGFCGFKNMVLNPDAYAREHAAECRFIMLERKRFDELHDVRIEVNKLPAVTRPGRLSTLFLNGARITRSYWRSVQASKINRG